MNLENKHINSDRIVYLLLLISIVIGGFLRIHNLDKLSLWFDELYSITASSKSFSLLSREMLNDPHPPFYQILLYLWIQLFGNSSFYGRLLSFFASIAALPFVFYFAKKVSDKFVALSTVIFLTFSSGAIFYAQELRSYSFLILFSAMSFFIWLRLLRERENSKVKISFFIISFFCSYTHYFGFVFINLLWLYYLFIHWKFSNSAIWNKIVFYLFLIALYLPEIYKIIFTNPALNIINWVPTPNIEIYIHFFSYVFYFMRFKRIPILFLILFSLIIPFFLKKRSKEVLKINERTLTGNFYPSLFIIVSLLVVTFLVSQVKPIVTSRNLLVILVPIYFVVVIWFSLCFKLRYFRHTGLVIALSVLMNLSFSKYYYKDFFKEPWRDVTKFALDSAGPTGYIFTYKLPQYIDYYLVDVYKSNPSKRLSYSERELLTLVETAKKAEVPNIVFIKSSWDNQDPIESKSQSDNLILLGKITKSCEIKHFIGFDVYRFSLE